MRGEDSGGLDSICMLGLISSPERQAARSALNANWLNPIIPSPAISFTPCERSTLTLRTLIRIGERPNGRQLRR